jgi:filamentous hemagglutinin
LTVMAGVKGTIGFDTIDQLFAELQTAGTSQNAQLGEVAVDKVFGPNNTGPGNITMYFSAIRTQGGSSIDLLAPNGYINAGLPSPGSNTNIGVYTTLGGGIRTYLSGDFNVDQSKVITMQGGDITIYSLGGNIDAGRGARDSRSTQPPRKVAILDPATGQPTGLFTFVPPIDAQGSGIRTLTSDPDGAGPLTAPKPGDIFLFAPRGFVNAGEAGVASAGNVFVAALQVLNASNITASGSSTGVPAVSTGGVSAAIASAASSAASATNAADQAVREVGNSANKVATKPTVPSFITVDVIGFGDDDPEKSTR